MYSNIGGKIKALAKVMFVIETVIVVIVGIMMFVEACDHSQSGMIESSIAVIVLGPLLAWVSSWMLYGFGEIIDKLCEIANNTRGGVFKSQSQTRTDATVSNIEN